MTTFGGLRVTIPRRIRDLDSVIVSLDRAVTRPIVTRAKEALARGEAMTTLLVFHAHGPRGRFAWVRIVDIPHPRALLAALRMRTRVVMAGLRLPGEGA